MYLTCSEPGLIPKIAFGFTPFATASSTIEAALDKSSYDELVQEPIKAHSISRGQSFAIALSLISATGVAKSGVKGPLRCGVNSERLISITWSKYFSGSAYTSASPVKCSAILSAASTTSCLPVAARYLLIESS